MLPITVFCCCRIVKAFQDIDTKMLANFGLLSHACNVNDIKQINWFISDVFEG